MNLYELNNNDFMQISRSYEAYLSGSIMKKLTSCEYASAVNEDRYLCFALCLALTLPLPVSIFNSSSLQDGNTKYCNNFSTI